MVGTLVGRVGVHHGVTFILGCAVPKCVHLLYLRYFSLMTKIYGLLQLIIYALLHNCAISIDSFSLINKFYSFINFGLLINPVILLLICLF